MLVSMLSPADLFFGLDWVDRCARRTECHHSAKGAGEEEV